MKKKWSYVSIRLWHLITVCAKARVQSREAKTRNHNTVELPYCLGVCRGVGEEVGGRKGAVKSGLAQTRGFFSGLHSKESACNTGDPGSIQSTFNSLF